MTDDLVERLRKAADEMRIEGQNGWPNTCGAAADAILQLQGEARGAFKALLSAMAQEGMGVGENADGSIIIKNNTAEAAEAEVARMQKQSRLLDLFMAFVYRWAWEKEGNGTSDAERLSAIKYHPILKDWAEKSRASAIRKATP